MHRFDLHNDRFMVLLAAGSLATTQAVVNLVRRDLENPGSPCSLNSCAYLFDAASYIGGISVKVQDQHSPAMQRSGFSSEATFILGGQIQDQPHEIYLIYPQGNYITASKTTPYLQIGETKYGKPILDRMAAQGTSLEDAARCALVSLDSTMRSNISVGPPVEVGIYQSDSFEMGHHLNLDTSSQFFSDVQKRWGEGIRTAFGMLPRFDWEM